MELTDLKVRIMEWNQELLNIQKSIGFLHDGLKKFYNTIVKLEEEHKQDEPTNN